MEDPLIIVGAHSSNLLDLYCQKLDVNGVKYTLSERKLELPNFLGSSHTVITAESESDMVKGKELLELSKA